MTESKILESENPKKLDINKIREDFPILKRLVHGKPLVYLDNAATSQKPDCVINAIANYYRTCNANTHRGVHLLSEEATEQYEKAHRTVAKFINAVSYKEIIFVRNATEAINLVAYSWGRANISKGDVIVLSEMEHHSNLVPWQSLAKEKGAELRFIEVDEDGCLRMDLLDSVLTDNVKIVSVTQMSNVLGTINPVELIIEKAHSVGALVMIDGAQSVAHMEVDVQSLDCDFLAFSGHKMVGPTGIGVLYAKRAILEEMVPFLGGGDMILEVKLRESTWNELPWKFEAGTPSIAQGIALGTAIDYLTGIGMAAIHKHEQELITYAMEKLNSIDGINILGPPPEKRGGLASFCLDDIHPHDIAAILDREGVAIRAGHHCAQPLHEKYGIGASARASFYLYNKKEEVDVLIEAINKAKNIFQI
ncbi:MAG: aminotransferase class V-fold PLP-dependent enzyme [Candidatus Anammoxibacter sp.]